MTTPIQENVVSFTALIQEPITTTCIIVTMTYRVARTAVTETKAVATRGKLLNFSFYFIILNLAYIEVNVIRNTKRSKLFDYFIDWVPGLYGFNNHNTFLM